MKTTNAIYQIVTLLKEVSPERIAEARAAGLVPQSGDWQKPGRFIQDPDKKDSASDDASQKTPAISSSTAIAALENLNLLDEDEIEETIGEVGYNSEAETPQEFYIVAIDAVVTELQSRMEQKISDAKSSLNRDQWSLLDLIGSMASYETWVDLAGPLVENSLSRLGDWDEFGFDDEWYPDNPEQVKEGLRALNANRNR